MRDLYLAIDVGTGSLRAALVDRSGRILAFASREHDQIVPQHGWSEQRPADWWTGTVESIREVLAKVENAPGRVAAICACGQMHGSVLIDDDGELTREAALLWNDKRTVPQVEAFAARVPTEDGVRRTANAPSPAWPAFKLAWLMENDRQSVGRASSLLMPKDWINYKLTGERAQDVTEASLSFLMDWKTRSWSDEMVSLTGVPGDLLPPLHNPQDVLAGLSEEAATLLGLSTGIPVLVGAGGTWGSFTLLDAGGDAVRWARRAFHDNRRSYEDVAQAATQASAGSNGLFFLPYLTGERFGDHANSRAQFFGLTASHGLPDLHRAVLEGVAFSVRHRLDVLQGGHGRPDRIVAASGGAKSRLWLEIKASMYNVPYAVPEELECGVVGAAMLASIAAGHNGDVAEATHSMVRFVEDVHPDPRTVALYDAMMPIYADLYKAAQPFYARLDALSL